MKQEIQIKNITKKNRAQSLYDYPLYTSSIINSMASTSQATRPRVVGQMSVIIPNFQKTFLEENNKLPSKEDWKNYYLKEYSENYKNGLDKIKQISKKYKEAVLLIDDKLIEEWYEDFMLNKNYKGFQFQKLIIDDLRKNYNLLIKKSSIEDESKNIDAWLIKDDVQIPLSIKPNSFNAKVKYYDIEEDISVITYKKSEDSLYYSIDKKLII